MTEPPTLKDTDRTPVAIIQTLLTTKWYWLLLVLLGLFLEGVALYYQYVVGEEPCQICIQTRIWVAAFILLGLIMCALPRKQLLNIAGHVLAVVCMVGLWERCWYLLGIENGSGQGSCQFFLGFPEWFALDKWFPFIFEVRNLCGFTPELFWGISMAQALIVLSTALVIVSVFTLAVNLWVGRSAQA